MIEQTFQQILYFLSKRIIFFKSHIHNSASSYYTDFKLHNEIELTIFQSHIHNNYYKHPVLKLFMYKNCLFYQNLYLEIHDPFHILSYEKKLYSFFWVFGSRNLRLYRKRMISINSPYCNEINHLYKCHKLPKYDFLWYPIFLKFDLKSFCSTRTYESLSDKKFNEVLHQIIHSDNYLLLKK